MTNSVPKLNDKVERQGSPNAGGKQRHHYHHHHNHHHHQRSGTIKSSTFFNNGNGRYSGSGNKTVCNNSSITTTAAISTPTSVNSTARLSCSPPCTSKNTRNSPLKCGDFSPRGSPTNNSFYAGAKFSEPPSPASLPQPPSHWTTRFVMKGCQQSDRSNDISNHLKMILNVQA